MVKLRAEKAKQERDEEARWHFQQVHYATTPTLDFQQDRILQEVKILNPCAGGMLGRVGHLK